MSPDRRQADRRQGFDRREGNSKTVSLGVFIITILVLLVIFATILTITIMNYENQINELLIDDATDLDLTLIPSDNDSVNSSTMNLTLID